MLSKIIQTILVTILFWILCVCLTSCSYTKRLNKWCARCPSKESVSVRDSMAVRFRDSVITHEAKEGPEINLVFGENCDSIKALLLAIQKNPIVKKKNGITSTIKSDGKKLDFTCNEDAYRDSLKNVITDRNFWRFQFEHKESTVKIPCENERTRFDGFTYWWFLITLGLLVLFGLYKYGNKLLKSIPWP